MAVGADRSCRVWLIRATVDKLVEMVHFEVRALLFMEGSRSEASTTPLPGAGSTNGVGGGFAPIRRDTPLIVGRLTASTRERRLHCGREETPDRTLS